MSFVVAVGWQGLAQLDAGILAGSQKRLDDDYLLGIFDFVRCAAGDENGGGQCE